MKELVIRKATEKDVDRISELENLSFSDPWSWDAIHEELVNNERAIYIVGEILDNPPEVVGYIGLWKIFDEGHIMNVCVDPKARGNKIGSHILETMIDVTSKMGITRWTLEVRKSNFVAIRLYKKYGFKEAGIRRGYYENNGEDAIIMWKNIDTNIN